MKMMSVIRWGIICRDICKSMMACPYIRHTVSG